MRPVTQENQRYASYLAAAETTFDIPFLLFDNADVRVFIDGEETLTFAVHATYQQDGSFATDGQIILPAPVTATVEIYGDRAPRRQRVFDRKQPWDPDLANVEFNILQAQAAEAHKNLNFLRLASMAYVDLKSHSGAVIGGHGGPWAWLQEAYWEAADSSRPIFASPGVYDFGDEAEQVSPGVGNVKLYGQYGHTIFKVFEGTDASPLSLINDTDINSSKGFLHFDEITFQGTFGETGRTVSQGAPVVFLDHYKDLKFNRCRWLNCTNMATDLHFNEDVSAESCVFQDLGRDGFRTRESKYVRAINNFFRRVGDDSIAFHGGVYAAGYDPDDGSPRREGLIAIGNTFVDTAAPITALGARQAIISGNMANRYRTYFCYIDNTPSGFGEGGHSIANVKITGNTALNLMTNSGGYVIIGADTPRGSTVTSGVVPGQPHSDGTFEYLWDHQNDDSTISTDAFPPVENIDISGNVFARTLPLVSNYSEWGFGLPASTTYGSDLAITDDFMRPPVGLNAVIGKVTTIRNNVVTHMDDGIILTSQTGVSPAMVGGAIEGNTIRDFLIRGVFLSGVSGKMIGLTLDNNTIDGDVYRQAANSNTDGTYDSGNTNPTAIDLSTSYGATVSRNRISNVARIMLTPENHICSDNIVLIDPAGYGDNAGNKGVRNMLPVERGFKYVIADCNPQSATYGEIKNVQLESSDAQPTSGYYIKGHYVTNSLKSRDPLKVLKGWIRVTTGSGHVALTDWMPDWSDFKQRLNNFTNITPGTIANGATYPAGGVPGTITVTGAKKGANTEITFEADTKGVTLNGWISADDVFSYLFINSTGASQTIAGAALRVYAENNT
jgi:hypothetical protein